MPFYSLASQKFLISLPKKTSASPKYMNSNESSSAYYLTNGVDRALILLFSVKSLLPIRFGRQHRNDFKDFSRWALTVALDIRSLLCKLGAQFLSLVLPDVFFSSSASCFTRILCLKSSDSLIFLSVGDGCSGITAGAGSSTRDALWTCWDPVAKLWCNGVLPREGVNSEPNVTDYYKTMSA